MQERHSISDLRAVPLLVAIALILLLLGAVLSGDLRGEGLSQSMAYHVLGWALYPVFYGSCLVLLVRLCRSLLQRKSFLFFDGRDLRAGSLMRIELSKVRLEIRTNRLGLREVHFYEGDARRLTMKAYSFAVPVQSISRTIEGLQRANSHSCLDTKLGHSQP
jgi:hypothetical protein